MAYFVPFCGLALDYVATYREEKITVSKLNREIIERQRTEASLQIAKEASETAHTWLNKMGVQELFARQALEIIT